MASLSFYPLDHRRWWVISPCETASINRYTVVERMQAANDRTTQKRCYRPYDRLLQVTPLARLDIRARRIAMPDASSASGEMTKSGRLRT